MFGNEVNKTNGEKFQKKKKKNYDGDTPKLIAATHPSFQTFELFQNL